MTEKGKVYTRTGDDGTTSLIGGVRVKKNHIRIEAYGTVDELNAQIGVLATYLSDEKDLTVIRRIQNDLFVLGGYLATDQSVMSLSQTLALNEEDVEFLEHIIDREEGVLPPWKGFILPGGTRAAAVAHVCRTVCRRTERCILALAETTEIDRVIIEYVNRLSDYFYVLARKLNFMAGVDEILWQKRCSFEK